MANSSPLEQASADLKVARLVVHKLGEAFDSFQVHSCSILSLAEQWRNLQASFASINKSLESRVKELENKERENDLVVNRLQKFEEEVELKQTAVEFGEKSLSGRISELELRQNDVKKWLGVIEAQRREIREREKAVEVKEGEIRGREKAVEVKEGEIREREKAVEVKEGEIREREKAVEVKEGELVDGLKRVEKVDEEEVRVRKVELEVNERCRLIELEESRIREVGEELRVREKGIEERCEAVGLRENRVDKQSHELEMRECQFKEHERVLMVRERSLNDQILRMNTKEKDHRALELRDQEMNELCSSLDSRESEISERFKVVESREKELKVREEEMKVHCELLVSKEKDAISRLDELNVKEIELGAGCRELEEREKGITLRSERLRVREKEVEKRSCDLDLKEKQVTALCEAVKEKESVMNEHWEFLELKGVEVDKRGKAMLLKVKQVEEFQGEEFEEGQINEGLGGLDSNQEQIDERCKKMEAKRMEISEHHKELEMIEKQLNRRKKAQDFRDNQFENLSKGLELKEKEINERYLMLEQKENQFNELSQALVTKENKITDLSQELESKEKQINELTQVLALKEKQRQEHLVCDLGKVQEVKDKLTNEESCKAKEAKVNFGNQHSGKLHLDSECLRVCSNNLNLKGKQLAKDTQELKSKSNQASNEQNFPALEVQNGDIAHGSCDKLLTESHKVVDFKEDQVNDTALTCESSLVAARSNASEGGASIFHAKDGKALQLFLNERVDKHKSLKKKLYKVLKMSTDPAKLVLDALDGFFEPHMSKDGLAFEASVVRSSCLLLLELLMFMQFELSKAVKKEATKVAVKWRAKMKVQGESEVVGVAFLVLLSTYNLNCLVKKADLWRLCELVDQHRLAPYLRKRLGINQRPNGSSNSDGTIKEPIQPATVLDSSSVNNSSVIHMLCRSMDGNGLRSYLIEHVKEYEVLRDNILDALRYASDPAKLVLDVCQISMTDLDKNFADDNNASCIFVLELLSKLSPSIGHEVKIKAKNFAALIKDKLKGYQNPVNHYRFLQFIASYKLTNLYDPDELLSYFKVLYWGPEVYRPEENVRLCFALGLTKKIPGVIKSLINRQKLLSAVKYICGFKLYHKFAPVRLLETHLEYVMKKVDQKRKEGTFAAKVNAENMESVALKNILSCIYDFKLESKLPPNIYVARLKVLEIEKQKRIDAKCGRKRSASPTPMETPLQQEKRPRVGDVQQCQPIASVQHSQPIDPVQQCRPAAPFQQRLPAAPVQQCQPAAPVQQCQPAAPVKQCQPAAPSYLPPYPTGGHPPRPEFYGPPYLPFGSHGGGHVVAPAVAPGHFMRPAPSAMYPVGAPAPIHRGNDQTWTMPNRGVF